MNPFALNAINAYAPAAATTAISNPYIGSGHVGGGASIFTPAVQPAFRGANPFAEVDEVAKIGQNKKEGFMNGLGGTNNPDNHKLFLYA